MIRTEDGISYYAGLPLALLCFKSAKCADLGFLSHCLSQAPTLTDGAHLTLGMLMSDETQSAKVPTLAGDQMALAPGQLCLCP